MTEKKYRTLGRAGEDVCDISGLPGRVSVITNALYRNAITLNPNGQAYMAQLSSMDNLKYENGVLYFKGLPATNAELRELCTLLWLSDRAAFSFIPVSDGSKTV